MSENFNTPDQNNDASTAKGADGFDAIVAGVEVAVPAVDFRKDGIYFYASNGGIVTYQDVMEGRVIMLVRVDTNISLDAPEGLLPEGDKLAKGVSLHPITVCKPDGSDCITTDGFTVKLPGHDRALNRPVRQYVKANTMKLLVRLYALGL